MSIQPLPNASAAAEPAISRRRAAERDTGAEKESFVLPQEEAAPEAAAPARESARETGRDSAEAQRSADEPVTTAAEKRSDTAAKPAAEQAASEASATETVKPAGKPASTVTAPGAQPATPTPDVGALVSIAIATQAEGQPAQAGKAAESAGDKPDSQKVEGEAGAAAAEPKAEAEAAVIVPVTQPVVFITPGPVPTLPVEPATAAAEAAGEGDLLSGKAGTAAAQAALTVMAARETLPAAASETTVPGQEMVGAAASPAPKKGLPVATSEASALPIDDGQVATPETVAAGTEKAVPIQGQTQSQAPAQASAPADLKPIEALQQALNPIDVSALGQQGSARPEPLRILTTPDQIAAQTTLATPTQTAAGGPPTPLHVLPIEIGLRALAGARQFDIRLDPGELGRVDVNLSISDSGEVSAKMVVDRVETLHLLQRDARTLERAFEQAGLKPSDAGVDITLRDPSDQSGFRQNRQQDEAPQRARVLAAGAEMTDDKPIIAQPAPVRRFVRLGGVDMSV
ncbi:MAG TPA: flagellar hook-length control protein FliK [Bosea sp. (in: a-proteobacteria)]|uniref:flagellar hook-length control protein FliK n=1 Tax=Bosea sp. (in: a-proteobacteria) TaxID=1871050 RepID=UPI002E0E9B0D|nr:flagellar hook-length control protein FliK [Bosea sp. (in: a-proteobacteria)]